MIQIDRHHDEMARYQHALDKGAYRKAAHHLQQAIALMQSGRDELNLWLHGARENLAEVERLAARKEGQCGKKVVA